MHARVQAQKALDTQYLYRGGFEHPLLAHVISRSTTTQDDGTCVVILYELSIWDTV